MLQLPIGYVENSVASRDSELSLYWHPESKMDVWQVPAYKIINAHNKENSIDTIMEIGCGIGYKATKFFNQENMNYLGMDQSSAIQVAKNAFTLPNFNWEEIDLEQPSKLLQICKEFRPDVILMLDVIEHLENPIPILEVFHKISKSENCFIFISTPIRDRIYGANLNGPPLNPLHVREWSKSEFMNLLRNSDFEILKSWDLFPRTYEISLAEIWLTAKRLLKFRRLIDSRSNQMHLIRAKS